MVGRLKQWFAADISPIGVDLGSHTVRLAQCAHDGTAWRLVAAACVDVPAELRDGHGPPQKFFVDAIKQALRQSSFVGRRAVLCVPSSKLHIRHVRLAKLDDADTIASLPTELAGHLPIDPARAVLRHQVAGEIQVGNETRMETIVLATPRDDVQQLIRTAEKAKLDVIEMTAEPKAIIDCFGHIYRRRADANVTNCFIDIGATVTRVTVARGQAMLFARAIPIGGDTFTQAVAEHMMVDRNTARQHRVTLAAQPIDRPQPKPAPAPVANELPVEESFSIAGLPPQQPERRTLVETVDIVAPAISPELSSLALHVHAATLETMQKLCEELTHCLRYHAATFPHSPVDRIIFVGGEARQRSMCQQIAQTLGVAAQLGDPLVRMGKTTVVGPESGLDAKQPQPAWAVALGLSMGPIDLQLQQRQSA